jgi:serine/threonine protein kinase
MEPLVIMKSTCISKTLLELLISVSSSSLILLVNNIAGIPHRDINTETILISEKNRIKLGELGVSLLLQKASDDTSHMGNSHFFMSPEVCRGTCNKSSKSDAWACGVVLYCMVYKKFPFKAGFFPDLFKMILEDE